MPRPADDTTGVLPAADGRPALQGALGGDGGAGGGRAGAGAHPGGPGVRGHVPAPLLHLPLRRGLPREPRAEASGRAVRLVVVVAVLCRWFNHLIMGVDQSMLRCLMIAGHVCLNELNTHTHTHTPIGMAGW